VWGVEYEDDLQVLRADIANLRRKIEPPGEHLLVRTDPGVWLSLCGIDGTQRDSYPSGRWFESSADVAAQLGTSLELVFRAYAHSIEAMRGRPSTSVAEAISAARARALTDVRSTFGIRSEARLYEAV
jgi:hypothetical protein